MGGNDEILSPLGTVRKITQKREYKTMAFLPNWSVDKYTKMPEGLDEVVFWQAAVNTGFRGKKIISLVNIVNDKKIDYKKELEKIKNTKTYDGINIDIEFNDNPLGVLDDDYLNFLAEMRKTGVKTIGVDVFANTIIKGSKEKLEKLFVYIKLMRRYLFL